jgi:hypothetical protein
MITTIIIHIKYNDESHSQQNPMIIPITILTQLNLHKRSNFIRKSTTTDKKQVFLKDKVTIELNNHIILISYLKTISLTRRLIISIKLN